MRSKKINLLPGPVFIVEEVKKNFGRVPISHRAPNFIKEISEVKEMLKCISRAKNVEICLGSGTLANDLIAAQLYLINKKGLILSNGEFGSRLIDHAKRFQLNFKAIRFKWGKPFDYKKIEKLINSKKFDWIWFVHHETSTGMLNDFSLIQDFANKNRVKICVDCISSIGAVQLDFSKIDFASGTSGKALASYPGLSFVFYKKIYSAKRTVPRYLDLRLYKKSKGVPFTSSSNLLSALKDALNQFLIDAVRFEKIKSQTLWIRKKLAEINAKVLVEGKYSSPIITTIVLPSHVSSEKIGNKLKSIGYHIHYQSSYLKKRNWIQISSMSRYCEKNLEPLFYELKKEING